jgi:16S rRNA (cytosine1402-N4)-methyltransferase
MHIPVLAEAVLQWLAVRPDGVYVDCTVGGGGHAGRIAATLRSGRLVGLDRDLVSVMLARERLAEYSNVTVLHRNFGELAEVLKEFGIDRIDGALIDAGYSSMQLDDAQRGFSFQEEGPLDMRMDRTAGPTAAQWLAEVSEPELARVLREYGDVGPARRIARAIHRRRDSQGLRTTRDLVEAVADALDFVHGMPEETRTVFQAVRMAVNDELRWLEAGLRAGLEVLAPGGRIVVISFHSGEDRIVKNTFRAASRVQRELYPDGRVRARIPARIRILTPKPVQPGPEEVRNNPRAHSARLRAVEGLVEEGGTA